MYTWLYENPDVYIPFPKEYHFPIDAMEHYAEINKIAMKYRNTPYHKYGDYSGPWIENIWIREFGNRSLYYFQGMVPLFFNWVDVYLVNKLPSMAAELTNILRPNVLYVTVSQSAEGLGQFTMEHPNILVLSSGGFGHIPLPLVKGVEANRPPPHKYVVDVSFVGSNRQERTALLRNIFAAATNVGLTTKQILSTKLWRGAIYGTKFNLAPRGFGRTSFRLAEIIQMGRIPIYLYNDVAWLPYLGTNVSLAAMQLSASFMEIEPFVQHISYLSKNATALNALYQQFDELRPLYTYEGIMQQINLFFQDPLQAGYLRCVPFPRTIVCCG
jgi:hypothetical protein